MPSPCAPVVNIRSYGGVGDGVADDTLALQSAIDAVGASGTLILPPGRWKFTSALHISHPYFTLIGGPGATLVATSNTSTAIWVHSDRVALESLHIEWTGTLAGTTATGGSAIVLDHCSDVRVSSCTIDGSRYEGIHILGATDFVVENNTILDTSGDGISATNGAQRGIIRGNTVDNGLIGIRALTYITDVPLVETGNILIELNTVTNSRNRGIATAGADHVRILSNTVNGTVADGIFVGAFTSAATLGSSNIEVAGNVVENTLHGGLEGPIFVFGLPTAAPPGFALYARYITIRENTVTGVTSGTDVKAGVELKGTVYETYVYNNAVSGDVDGAAFDPGTTPADRYRQQSNTYNGVLVGSTGTATIPPTPTDVNLPPTITLSAASVRMTTDDTVTVAATAHDPENAAAVVEVVSTPPWATTRVVSSSEVQVTLRPTTVGSGYVQFRAVDPLGHVSTVTVPVTVSAGTGTPTGPTFNPTNLILGPAVTSIALLVAPPVGADRLRVDTFTGTTGAFVSSTFVTAIFPTTSFTITGLTAATLYRVRVYAAQNGQAPNGGDYTEGLTTTQAVGAGGAGSDPSLRPTNVTAAPGTQTIMVSATPPSGSDRLLISWSGPIGFIGQQYVTAIFPTTQFQITGLVPATTYSVSVSSAFNAQAALPGTVVQVSVLTDPTPTGGVTATGEFQIVHSATDQIARLYDPDGKLYIPIGVNSDGPNAFFGYPCQGQAARLKGLWNINHIRLVCCYPRGADFGNYVNNQPRNLSDSVAMIRAIVNEYQALKMVVCIDLHVGEFGAPPPTNASEAQSWWQIIATEFKNDPWVWFEAWNEPGGTNVQWSVFHNAIISTIRATGARNLIVVDDRWAGQGAGDWWDITPSPSADSALISASIVDPLTRVVGASHPYDVWGFPNDEDHSCLTRYTNDQRDARLRSYLTRIVHDRGVPVIFNEFGWRAVDQEFTGISYHGTLDPFGTHPPCGSTMLLAGETAFRVCDEFDVGCAMWSEGFPLTNGVEDVYERTGVTLTRMGQDFDAFGVAALARMAAAATQQSGPLAQPSNLSTTPTATTVQLTATPPAGADRIYVQWLAGSTVIGSNYVTATVPTSYLIAGLTASTDYTIRVGAAKPGQNVDAASLVTLFVSTTAAGAAPTNVFTFDTDGAGVSRVFKDSKLFIPLGVNMPADHGYWGGGFVGEGQASRIKATWGWNFIRLFQQDVGGGECEFCPDANNGFTIADAVAEYTALGYVVMIDYHYFGFGRKYEAAQITKLVNFWTPIAASFKTNPLVWFEITNEPESTYWSYVDNPLQTPFEAWAAAADRWYNAHVAAVDAIRGAGAPNVIVCNDAQTGQGCDDFFDVAVYTPVHGSAILRRGANLVAHDNALTNGGKLMWDVHVYDEWGFPNDGSTDCSNRFTDAQRDLKFRNYVQQVHAFTGRPLLMGEFGYQPGDSETTGVGYHTFSPECGSLNMLSQKVGMRVGKEFDMGGTQWPGFQLTPNGNDAYDYQNRYPTGEDWWQYCQWGLARIANNSLAPWPAPTSLASSAVTNNSARLSWTTPVTTRNITGVRITWFWGGVQRGSTALIGGANQFDLSALPASTSITARVGFRVDGQEPTVADTASTTFSTIS